MVVIWILLGIIALIIIATVVEHLEAKEDLENHKRHQERLQVEIWHSKYPGVEKDMIDFLLLLNTKPIHVTESTKERRIVLSIWSDSKLSQYISIQEMRKYDDLEVSLKKPFTASDAAAYLLSQDIK
jgi:hypothetical protein